ncbi:hypothetical protein Tco_0337527 [Tanacetum coccineum]
MGGEHNKESDEEEVDRSMNLKGIEILSDAAQFELDLKKARKASKDDFFLQQCPKGSGEGSGVALEVPDGLNLKGPSEGSNDKKKVDDSKIADDEKAIEEQG